LLKIKKIYILLFHF